MQGVNISEKTFRILAGYVKPWPGEKIDEDGLISVVNVSGRKPPLVWVFNSHHEFVELASALGADQPLIGMRSLNAVVSIYKLIAWDERILADHYAETLKRFLGGRAFFVGGNCQGAPIAAYLARALLLSGARLHGFVAMEWADLTPLPVQTTLIFGEDSPMHNPFLKNLDPVPEWERMYPGHEVAILPGSHGTYFSPELIPNLVNTLQDAMSVKTEAGLPDRKAIQLIDLPASCHVNQMLFVSVASEDGFGKDDVMLFWDRHVPALPHREWARPSADKMGVFLRIAAPGAAGIWTVQSYRCSVGEGPVAWAQETKIYSRIEVLDK